MAYYVLLYEYVPDIVERRIPYREAHLALAREWHAEGRLLMAGALSDPIDGAILVFSVETPGEIQPFIDADPYVMAGLVLGFRVRPWAVVVGPQ
jgi:uncharacterized protein YciI